MENSRFKFRVWDKQDECYAYSNNSDVDVLYIETDGELTYGVYSNDYEDMSYIPESEVIVEQCTGLKDKNGKLIYEGDWLKTKDGYYCYVVWFDGFWWVKSLPSEAMDLEGSEFYKECEIVGNINEQPDFMELLDD